MKQRKMLTDSYDGSKDSSKSLMNKISKVVRELQRALNPTKNMQVDIQKNFSMNNPEMQKLMKVMEDLIESAKKNFREGVSGLVPPENYNPSTLNFSPIIHEFTTSLVSSLIEKDISVEFPELWYLKGRLEAGLNAHLKGDYYLSIFALFSVIDGMLTWFYCKNNNCSKYPSFDKKYDYFMKRGYNLQDIVEVKEMKQKLEYLKMHRNEIMHGGKFAYFDTNISIIVMLFFTLIYSGLKFKPTISPK